MRRVTAFLFGPPERVIEYSFVIRNLLRLNTMKLLEVGCGESSLSYKLARMGFDIVTVDLNPYPFTHQNLKSLLGDITEIKLPNNNFDCGIMVSTIEHIGMGWYGDSKRTDGDFLSLKKTVTAIKEQGFLFITVPIAPTYREILGRTRIYDFESLDRLFRLSNLHVSVAEYYMPTKKVGRYALNWVKATRDNVIKGRYLKIYPHCTACLILQKIKT